MKWIDQVVYVCVFIWLEGYVVIVYVGGIWFYQFIYIGSFVKVMVWVIYIGNISVYIVVDVFFRKMNEQKFYKIMYCVIVFVFVDGDGKLKLI